jgi:hypothetical protein
MASIPEANRAEAHWNEVYSTKPETQVSWFEEHPRLSLALIERTGAVPEVPVIDIGGGLSKLPGALLDRGFQDVTLLDISEQAIGLQTARRPQLKGVVADVTRWRPNRRYGIWHDRAVLHFLTDEAGRAAYRRALDEGLAIGGQAIIATFAPDGPERCSGLPVWRSGLAEKTSFLGQDFEPAESFEFDHTTPAGGVQRFHVGRFVRGA